MPNSNWKWKYQNFPQNKSHSGAQFQLQNVTGFWENPSQNLGVGRNQSWEKIEIHVANVIGFPMFWKWRRVSRKTNHKLAVSFILALWFLFGRWICPWKNSNGKVWRVSRGFSGNPWNSGLEIFPWTNPRAKTWRVLVLRQCRGSHPKTSGYVSGQCLLEMPLRGVAGDRSKGSRCHVTSAAALRWSAPFSAGKGW